LPTDILFARPAVFIVGGIAQVLAAMWSFRKGDTLAATAFGAFGSFNVLFAWQYWLIPTPQLLRCAPRAHRSPDRLP
jgi:succinate-acetate transporter protein